MQKMLRQMSVENEGLNNKFKLSAVVVKRRAVVGTGVNSYKTHPLMVRHFDKEYHVHLHAEVDAIRNAARQVGSADLSGCDLYVGRVKKDGDKWVDGLARSCPGCVATAAAFGIKNIYYTEDYDGDS